MYLNTSYSFILMQLTCIVVVTLLAVCIRSTSKHIICIALLASSCFFLLVQQLTSSSCWNSAQSCLSRFQLSTQNCSSWNIASFYCNLSLCDHWWKLVYQPPLHWNVFVRNSTCTYLDGSDTMSGSFKSVDLPQIPKTRILVGVSVPTWTRSTIDR